MDAQGESERRGVDLDGSELNLEYPCTKKNL